MPPRPPFLEHSREDTNWRLWTRVQARAPLLQVTNLWRCVHQLRRDVFSLGGKPCEEDHPALTFPSCVTWARLFSLGCSLLICEMGVTVVTPRRTPGVWMGCAPWGPGWVCPTARLMPCGRLTPARGSEGQRHSSAWVSHRGRVLFRAPASSGTFPVGGSEGSQQG